MFRLTLPRSNLDSIPASPVSERPPHPVLSGLHTVVTPIIHLNSPSLPQKLCFPSSSAAQMSFFSLPNVPPLLAVLSHLSCPMNIYSATLSFASVAIHDLWLCTIYPV